MLNEWSDRSEDDAPPSLASRSVNIAVAAIVTIGTLIFVAELVSRFL
ncbi:hypothetical protein [uncultured Sphingobium sp.]|nr:hypothetical protein [uncultured Sphingobium sp.]